MATTTKSYVTLQEKYDRIIVLIDMDAFYCQVEEKLNPSLKGKPIAVCQYQENSGIIAVNYPAKALGITRHMREREALAACKDLTVIKVASKNGKADISKYREAGTQVAKVFHKYTNLLERASIDEAYLDITENVAKRMEEMSEKKFEMQAQHFVNTFAVGYDTFGNFIKDVSNAVDQENHDIEPEDRASYNSSKLRLLVAGTVVSDIRKGVFEETGYTCSAGIAHNKILAKLVCGMNKPNKQTIIPLDSIHGLFSKLEIHKIKSMGGKTGEQVCKTLNVKVMNDLLKFSEEELTHHFGARIGKFLYLIARGIDLEKVVLKVNSKSIAVSKNFRGPSEINNCNTLKYWLTQLSKEVKERLDSDALDTNRISRQLIVQFTQFIDGKNQACSRTVQLNGNIVNNFSYEEIASEAYSIIQKTCTKFLKVDDKPMLNHNIRHLGISASKFESNVANQASTSSIQNFLNNNQKKILKEEEEEAILEEIFKSDNESENEEEETKMEVTPHPIRVKPASELMGVLKKYEFDKSDKEPSEMEVNEIGVQKEEEVLLRVCNKFSGDNSIQGIETLKHWITELFKDLNEKITKDSITKNQAPQEIEFRWSQIINDEKMDFSEIFPVSIFKDETFNVELIVDSIRESLSDFMKDGKVNPITFIEISPINFKKNERWKLKLITENNDLIVEEENPFLNETIPYEKEEESNTVDEPMNTINCEEVEDLEQNFLHSNFNQKECLPSTSKTETNYTATYIELQGGEGISIDDLNPLEECLECGKKIRKYDMITHIDHHIAMKLAQAQREEFREEQKRKHQGKTTPKPKKVVSFVKKNTIEKFAKKRDENDSQALMDNQILCDECSQIVDESDYQTHKDHHFAQKLRKEQLTNSLKLKEGNKRKILSSASSSNSNSAKKSKSLKEFFVK